MLHGYLPFFLSFFFIVEHQIKIEINVYCTHYYILIVSAVAFSITAYRNVLLQLMFSIEHQRKLTFGRERRRGIARERYSTDHTQQNNTPNKTWICFWGLLWVCSGSAMTDQELATTEQTKKWTKRADPNIRSKP